MNYLYLTSGALFVGGCLGLVGGCLGPNTAPHSVPKADSGGAGIACVPRIQGIHAPPTRLAPHVKSNAKEYDHDDDRDKDDLDGRTSHLGFKPICPEGKVPAPRAIAEDAAIRVPKGNPLLGPDPSKEFLKFEGAARADFIRRHVRSFEDVYRKGQLKPEGTENPPPPPPPACDGVFTQGSCYYYGNAGFQTVADGGGMTEQIEKPSYVNSGGSGHSLNELAVQGGDGNGNIIELGWLVSSEQYGNNNPHLFVFHWKDWNPTCYDTCGWVQWSGTYHPSMDLGSAVGKEVYIGYVLYQGNWWAWFDDQWMGYFPGSEWDGQYTKTSLIQWFGEVASQNGIPPKTGMGDNLLPSSEGAANMATLCDVDAKAWVCWYSDEQSLSATVPKYYAISRVAFGAVRYGGPGQ
jgi:hypothetical protein